MLKLCKPDGRILGEDYLGKSCTGDDLPMEVVYTTRSHERSTTMIKNRITAMTLAQDPTLYHRIKFEEIKEGDFSCIE